MSDEQERVNNQLLIGLVEQSIPQSDVDVRLFSGVDHFEMRVISPAFAGKSKVMQHQMVYQALGNHMRNRIHALALKTYTPEQWRQTENKE